MLRGNLSTRPFYNERAVHLALAVATVLLVGLTIFSARQFFSLSRQQTAFSARIAQDEQRAATLRREAARVRGNINQQELATVVAATREVNRVIDERVFSWTALFNVLEQAIPTGVALAAVYPTIDDEGAVTIRLVVTARRVEDVGAFMDALDLAGPFSNLQTVEELRVDDGSFVVTFDSRYAPPVGAPAPTDGTVASADASRPEVGR